MEALRSLYYIDKILRRRFYNDADNAATKAAKKPKKQKGGKRDGAGRKRKYDGLETTTIRVPVCLAREIQDDYIPQRLHEMQQTDRQKPLADVNVGEKHQ